MAGWVFVFCFFQPVEKKKSPSRVLKWWSVWVRGANFPPTSCFPVPRCPQFPRPCGENLRELKPHHLCSNHFRKRVLSGSPLSGCGLPPLAASELSTLINEQFNKCPNLLCKYKNLVCWLCLDRVWEQGPCFMISWKEGGLHSLELWLSLRSP